MSSTWFCCVTCADKFIEQSFTVENLLQVYFSNILSSFLLSFGIIIGYFGNGCSRHYVFLCRIYCCLKITLQVLSCFYWKLVIIQLVQCYLVNKFLNKYLIYIYNRKCLPVCLFFVPYAQPQFWADLHRIWHVASLCPPDGHGGLASTTSMGLFSARHP